MIGKDSTAPWLVNLKPQPDARLRLFCFPYAGTGAHIFHSWSRALPGEVMLCPVQLPGRERRLHEPMFTSLPPLVQAIAEALLPNFYKPFAFFGHSMGGLISFELARWLRKQYGLEPTCLFVSGCRAPQVSRDDKPFTFDLPEPEFVEELRRLNGTPQAVLEHPELMRLMIPLLRADFEVVQTYLYTAAEPLSCPIRAYGGVQDPEVTREDVEAWRQQSVAPFSFKMFPGDHFFIHSARSLLLAELARELEMLLWRIR